MGLGLIVAQSKAIFLFCFFHLHVDPLWFGITFPFQYLLIPPREEVILSLDNTMWKWEGKNAFSPLCKQMQGLNITYGPWSISTNHNSSILSCHQTIPFIDIIYIWPMKYWNNSTFKHYIVAIKQCLSKIYVEAGESKFSCHQTIPFIDIYTYGLCKIGTNQHSSI